MKIAYGEHIRDVRLERDTAILDGEGVAFHEDAAAPGILEVAGQRHRIRTARQGDRVFVWCDGFVFEFVAKERQRRAGSEAGDLLAPMPGRIRQTMVAEGEAVQRGQVLLILEAMKMEHAIRSPRDGTVRRLPHRDGDLVETGTALVVLA